MILVKKLEISITFVFAQNKPWNNIWSSSTLENNPFNTIRILILQRCHTRFFSKGLTHDFGQKLKISSLFVSGQNRPWNNVWWSFSKKKPS